MSKAKHGGSGLLALIALVTLLAAAFAFYSQALSERAIGASASSEGQAPMGETGLEAHFIDVGQADCELIISGSESLLIDAGEAPTADSVIEYIKSQGVSELTYVVATHPHSDHIGGMAKILDSFPVKNFITPDVTHTTKTFENMLDALERNNIEITIPSPGDVYALGNAELTVLSPPDKQYDNLNNYSVVVKAKYGAVSLLFTGDAEHTIEEELLANDFDLRSDVLKVGHHGSRTSSTQNFLDAVSPSIAVISCGLENSYGHPHKETLEKIKRTGAEIYQTSLDGTIILKTDGKAVAVKTSGS